MAGEDQLMWLEDDADEENEPQRHISVQNMHGVRKDSKESEHSAAVAALEDELQRTRKELMDVRKELAAKTVQLSRKEVVVAQERVAELAASVATEKDKQLASLATHIEQLEAALGQKEEELEESRRLYVAQKRALREALAAAAEAEAVERQADEARARTAVAQAVEDELEQLQHELALLQARYDLEMRARDAELQSLRQELAAANANRKQAVAAAEAALSEAWQAEVARATEEAEGRVAALEAEVARVRQQMEEAARSSDAVTLAGELAALNQQKVAIQREFDAFRDLATAAARQNREDAARLLEENATLKSRLAARAFQDVQAGFKPQSKVFTALTPPGGHAGAGAPPGGDASGVLGLGSWGDLPALLAQWERQRRGLTPLLLVGSLVALLMLLAVVRAAAATRSEHRGGLCFLAHLGINVGKGCGLPRAAIVGSSATEELEHLLDAAPRVHDVDTSEVVGLGGSVTSAPASAAVVASGAGSAAVGSASHPTAAAAAAAASGSSGGGGGSEAGSEGGGEGGGEAAAAAAAADGDSSAPAPSSSGDGDAGAAVAAQGSGQGGADGGNDAGAAPVPDAPAAGAAAPAGEGAADVLVPGGEGSASAAAAEDKEAALTRRARSALSQRLPAQRLWAREAAKEGPEGRPRGRAASRRQLHPAR